MDKDRWLPPIRCMHEWPLVLFTALAVPAAGVYGSALIADAASLPLRTPTYLRAVAAALLVTGLVFSVLHLGRPRRAVLALVRAGRNVLSTEVVFLAALTLLSLGLLVPAAWEAAGPVLQWLAGACGVALLVTFGFVYFLRGRSPWRSILVAGPLVSGLAAGSVLLATVPHNEAVVPMALGLLVSDATFCLAAWRKPTTPHGLPAHPAIQGYRRRLLALRLLFTNVLPAALIVTGFSPSAAIAVGTGVLLDRFSFYGLATVESTEACVTEVEQRIRQHVM
jgi:DMSO reductase anchor subunit